MSPAAPTVPTLDRGAPASPPPGPPGSLRGLALPLLAGALTVTYGLLVVGSPRLSWSFLGAGAGLLAWCAALAWSARRRGRTLTLDLAAKKQHWVQACAQTVVLLYWGWHVDFVYAFLPLILAQVVFAYGVDSLLGWSRRDRHTLGFGPVPVILSINLFLWFRPEWFFLQFLMIVVGYLGKELIRWERDGRSAHIFNPSSFPLGLAAVALILSGTTGITMGPAIAGTQAYPPHMYLVIFLAALPGQLLFGVARMTLSAVVTLFAVSWGYFALTGTYLFYDAHISVPVFLGMHLLFTDPSTAPRTESGRLVFGALYAILIAGSFGVLYGLGMPTFYDKLLPVPFLNLMVRRIDRITRASSLARFDPARVAPRATPRARHLGYTGLWAGAFVLLSAFQGVGDWHPGQSLPFWRGACGEGSGRACTYADALTRVYCANGSGWACNEWGVRLAERDPAGARPFFARSCELGFGAGCANQGGAPQGVTPVRGAPTLEDLPIVIRGTKPPLRGAEPAALYARACAQGWPGTCGRTAGR